MPFFEAVLLFLQTTDMSTCYLISTWGWSFELWHKSLKTTCIPIDCRYIESLNSESRTVGDFERSLTATQENTQPKSTTQLPTQWLGQGAGYHDSVVTALWALRDLMMKDTLNVQRTLSFDQLCKFKTFCVRKKAFKRFIFSTVYMSSFML